MPVNGCNGLGRRQIGTSWIALRLNIMHHFINGLEKRWNTSTAINLNGCDNLQGRQSCPIPDMCLNGCDALEKRQIISCCTALGV